MTKSPGDAGKISDADRRAFVDEQIDRMAVIEIVQRERLMRDTHDWSELAACYNEDSVVDMSWFKGTGAEFAAASQRMAAGGLTTFHQMTPSVTRLWGNRAIADTGSAIHLLTQVKGADVDVIGFSRMYARVERKTDKWLLSGLRAVYISDLMLPTNPSNIPQIDPDDLKDYRGSYRHLSFILAQRGHPPSNDLPGFDRPETVRAVRLAEEEWLYGR